MDESDRVVVLDPRTQVVEERELQVHPGPQGEAAGIHRVLQRDDGEAVQVDVQRKTLSYLNFEMRLTPGCTSLPYIDSVLSEALLMVRVKRLCSKP